ncbi:MAG: hypothetical protein IKA88_04495, partial [Clostridia bacterium]|nr:hypothetical protein [Clostridia bacterium]
MMKKSKKILLASMLATGFVFGGAMALGSNVASASDSAFNGIDFTKVVMSDGASVRVANDNNYGIRFQMNMDAATYATLETKDASYGIAIFPADYNYVLSESVIFAAESKATLVESATLSDMNNDGTYDMWGSLVNIQPKNVTREFVGIGYVKIGTEYKLANAYQGDIANNTRSIYYVAQRAVAENDKNAAAAKEQYIDTFDTTAKEYAYTVNHVYKNSAGEVVKTDSQKAYGTLNTTVTATPEADGWYKYDAENSKISDTLYANGKTTLTVVYEDNSVAAKYNAKYVKQENGAITLNAANFNVQLAGVEKMYVDGKEVAVTPVSATEISIPAAAGVRQIAVYDGDKCYYGDVTVADYVITNQATLQGWYSKISSAKYTVVANDVVCDGTDLVDWGTWEQNMTGTFDGLGHTISNANYYGGFLNGGQMATGSAIKNVTFDNLTVSSMYYALFGRYMNGALIENVNANVNYTAFDTINGGLITHQTLGYRLGQVDTFRNCNFNFTVPAGDVDKVAKVYSDNEGYDGAVLENVTIIFNGKVAKAGEAYDGSEGKPAVTLGEKSSWTNVTIIDKDDTETLTSSQKGVLIDATEATLDMTKFAKSVTISDLKVNGAAANWEIK